jgi:hypothetical protein
MTDICMSLITACNRTCVLAGVYYIEQFETAVVSGPSISSSSGGHMLMLQSRHTLLTGQVSVIIFILMSSKQYLIIVTAPRYCIITEKERFESVVASFSCLLLDFRL